MTAMAKPKKRLTSAQRAAKKQRKKDFITVFMNGKQVRVRREPTIDGMDVEDFIRHNADPIWLHQNGYHELLDEHYMESEKALGLEVQSAVPARTPESVRGVTCSSHGCRYESLGSKYIPF